MDMKEFYLIRYLDTLSIEIKTELDESAILTGGVLDNIVKEALVGSKENIDKFFKHLTDTFSKIDTTFDESFQPCKVVGNTKYVLIPFQDCVPNILK